MRRGSSPPDDVLGQNRQTFLRLLVRREPDGQELQGLRVAVAIGEHVGPDLVLDQWLDAVLAEAGGGRDEELAERHHQIGHVVAHLDRYGEPRIARSVPLELRTCRLGECRRGDAARRDRRRIDELEQRAGRRDQRFPGFAVQLEAAVPEARRAAILQQGDLPGDLVTLGSEERVERRILHALDLHVVEVALDQVRIEVERPRLQDGGRLEPRAFEILPRLGAVCRRDTEQAGSARARSPSDGRRRPGHHRRSQQNLVRS